MHIVDRHLLFDRTVLALRHLDMMSEADEDFLVETREALWLQMTEAERGDLDRRWGELREEMEKSFLA